MQITKKDVSDARLVYWLLLFLLPFNLVPCLGFVVSFAAFIWLVIFAFSKKPFVAAHARQGLLLCLLELTLGIILFVFSLSDSRTSSNITWLLTAVACGAWVIANIGGLIQAGHGNSWVGGIHAKIVPIQAIFLQSEPNRQPLVATLQEEKSVEHYLKLFHTGDLPDRIYATFMLEELGEVEVF